MKYLTLMIIPYPGADVRSIRIKHRTIKLLSGLAALLVCISIATLFYLKPILEKAREYDRLLSQNQLLSVENRKIRALAQKMVAIDNLVTKIQTTQGVKETGKASGEGEGQGTETTFAFMDNFAPVENALAVTPPTTDGEDKNAAIPSGLPVKEKSYISRTFNPEIFHFGIDIPLKQGTAVRATADGVVTLADKSYDLGFYVMIKHASGYSTLYAHNSLLAVNKGDRIKKGDLIAYSGNMGQSTAPHLHYAIFDQNGNPMDPLPFLEQ
jgi:murein DD-endopeptidase MepM/ murein hydrolase activator NlpD